MTWDPFRQGYFSTQKPPNPTNLQLPTNELRVVEWDYTNLKLFYPIALTSTWTMRTVIYPLTVLQARLQLQKQTTVYQSTLHAFRSIVKHEGIAGLYRGFWIVPQIGTTFIYSTIYEKIRAALQYNYGIQSVSLISSIAGGAASICSQVIFVPTDIIAQHMMIFNYTNKFMSGNDKKIIEYLRSGKSNTTLGLRVTKAIYHTDGLAGFYRGFLASSLVYVPSCFTFWPAYYYFQDVLKSMHKDKSFLLLDQAIAATLGGACSTIATNPMEVYRIRLQVHRTNYSETLARMIRNEGWTVFSKGLPPRLISNSIYLCIVMVGYEIVKRFCVLSEYKDKVK